MNKRHGIATKILTLVLGLTSVALLQAGDKKASKQQKESSYVVKYPLGEGIIEGVVTVEQVTSSRYVAQTFLHLPSNVVLCDGLGRSNALIQLPSAEMIKKSVGAEGEAYKAFIQRSGLASELGGKRLDGLITWLAIKRAVQQDANAGNNPTVDVDTLVASVITDRQQLATIDKDYDKIQEKMEGAVVAQIEQ